MKDKIYEELCQIVGEDNAYEGEPLKWHTTFKIGGPADYLVQPKSVEEIQSIVKLCREADIPILYLGRGSNILARDKGYRGLILDMTRMDTIVASGHRITADAGANMGNINNMAYSVGLGGYEFACDIPGTIGGGVRMNSGFTGEDKIDWTHEDVVEKATVMDKDGNVYDLSNEELNFKERRSETVVNDDLLILSVTLNLKPMDRDDILEKRKSNSKKRFNTVPRQPQLRDFPSAGSVFKRSKFPDGKVFYVGTNIQEAGLKGERRGDAMVSKDHAGFIVNMGNATSEDVETLMEDITQKIQELHNVTLEPEIQIIGER